MQRNDQEQPHNLSKLNRNRIPKEEVLEWSPTGYGLISAVTQPEPEEDSEILAGKDDKQNGKVE